MDADAKKTTLRMIPYGIYVLTADDGKGTVGAATVNWVTQTAFAPPMVVVGVKADSGVYAALKTAGTFALNMLGKEHKGLAFAFFKPAKLENGMLSGQSFLRGRQRRADPRRRDRRGRMPREDDRRGRRPPHRRRRGDRRASAPTRRRAGRTRRSWR